MAVRNSYPIFHPTLPAKLFTETLFPCNFRTNLTSSHSPLGLDALHKYGTFGLVGGNGDPGHLVFPNLDGHVTAVHRNENSTDAHTVDSRASQDGIGKSQGPKMMVRTYTWPASLRQETQGYVSNIGNLGDTTSKLYPASNRNAAGNYISSQAGTLTKPANSVTNVRAGPVMTPQVALPGKPQIGTVTNTQKGTLINPSLGNSGSVSHITSEGNRLPSLTLPQMSRQSFQKPNAKIAPAIGATVPGISVSAARPQTNALPAYAERPQINAAPGALVRPTRPQANLEPWPEVSVARPQTNTAKWAVTSATRPQMNKALSLSQPIGNPLTYLVPGKSVAAAFPQIPQRDEYDNQNFAPKDTEAKEEGNMTPVIPTEKPAALSYTPTVPPQNVPEYPPVYLARPLTYYDNPGFEPHLHAGKLKILVPTGVKDGNFTAYDTKPVYPPFPYVHHEVPGKLIPIFSGSSEHPIALTPDGGHLKPKLDIAAGRNRRRDKIAGSNQKAEIPFYKQTAFNPPSKNSIAAHLEFDASSGDLILDTSGRGNDAVMSGAATLMHTDYSCGMAIRLIGGEVKFDGVKFTPKPSTAVSVAVWVKLNSTAGRQSIFTTVGYAHSNGQYHLEIVDGRILWSHVDENNNVVFNCETSEKYVQPHQWAHITGTYDSGESKFIFPNFCVYIVVSLN